MVARRVTYALLIVGSVFSVLLLVCRAWADTSSADSYHLSNMHKHPWFLEVMVASIVGWVTGRVKGFSGAREWLEHYWNGVPVWLVFVADVILFVVVGGYFGTGIYKPGDFLQALAAGISWPIGLGALVTTKTQ